MPFTYGRVCSVLEEEEEHWHVKLGGSNAEGGNGGIIHAVDWQSVVGDFFGGGSAAAAAAVAAAAAAGQ